MKVHSFFTALLFSAALMAGCVPKPGEPVSTLPTPTPEPVTAESLLADMSRALLAEGSAAAEVRGTVAYILSTGKGERETRADLTMKGGGTFSPFAVHAAGTAGMEVLGIAMDVPVEFYALTDENGAALYLNVLGAWMKQSTAVSVPEGEPGLERLARAAVLREDTETVNGHVCHRLDISVTGEMFASSAPELDLPAPESVPALDAVLWADAESRLPVRLSLSLTEPLVSGGLSIRELTLLIDYTDFGTVGSLTPPPEALAAPEAGGK